jgi:hypothetical protein
METCIHARKLAFSNFSSPKASFIIICVGFARKTCTETLRESVNFSNKGVPAWSKCHTVFSIHFVCAGHLLVGRVGHRVVQASRISDDCSVEHSSSCEQPFTVVTNVLFFLSKNEDVERKTRTLKEKQGH